MSIYLKKQAYMANLMMNSIFILVVVISTKYVLGFFNSGDVQYQYFHLDKIIPCLYMDFLKSFI